MPTLWFEDSIMTLSNREKFLYEFGVFSAIKKLSNMPEFIALQEVEKMLKKYNISKLTMLEILEFQMEIAFESR